MDSSELNNINKSLKIIKCNNKTFFNSQIIETFIANLDGLPKTESYSHVSDENKQIWSAIEHSGGGIL